MLEHENEDIKSHAKLFFFGNKALLKFWKILQVLTPGTLNKVLLKFKKLNFFTPKGIEKTLQTTNL